LGRCVTDMSMAAEMATSQFRGDPYPFYARWRSRDPVPLDAQPGEWLVTTYANAVGILRDTRFRVCRPRLHSGRDGQDVPQLRDIVYRWLLFENPPDHARMRILVNHAFAPDFVADMRPAVAPIVAAILDECAERRSFDLIADAAVPIAVLVLADAMGLSRIDSAYFTRWSAQIAPLVDGTLRPSYVDTAAQTVAEMAEYLNPVIQARRADPGDDLISRLAATREHGAALSHAELLATCVLLLTAGHETSAALLGNGVVALLEHPAELHRLRNDPSLGPLAVEELLRFDSPIQLTSRAAVQDLKWAGTMFAAGSVMNIVLGSANRDSAQFADSDSLDVGRTRNPHLAFGGGIHFCPGAGLARLETRIAIEQLLQRFPSLTLGPGDSVRRPGAVLRGFTSLPVHL
jgi:pimeloyl-[acyl-carrier protein] synthase